ncbi:MAG: hypothetical protein HYX24_06175 [Candidatus Aenigmarchaeota archaeon]|nr:hypothetical protein [Candidatus Aenigmarchaeota archaeon]
MKWVEDAWKQKQIYIMMVFSLLFLIIISLPSNPSFKTSPLDILFHFLSATIPAVAIDLAMMKKRKQVSFPYSAIITGLIAGSLLPVANHLSVFAAGLFAGLSKRIIKINNRHMFNPAAFGIGLAIPLFVQTDAWWAVPYSNFLPAFILLMALGIVVSNKIRKLYLSFSFLLAYLILSFFIFKGDAAALISGLPFYMAFFMLTEPKTSAALPRDQLISGAFTGLACIGLSFIAPTGFLIYGLLLNNIFVFLMPKIRASLAKK